MPDARWRPVGDDSHAATWRGCRWLLTLTLSSLRCARAKPARVVSSRDRSALPSSHRDGSCRDACSASLGMMVAGCERLPSSASAQYPPIPVPCLSTCMPSLWGGVVFVRRQSPTLPTGSVTSHINDTPREKGKPSHLPDPPAGCRSLFLITPRSLGQRSRAVAPYRPSLTRWTRKPLRQPGQQPTRDGREAGLLGALFCPARGWTACFLELPDLLRRRSDATGRLARPPSLRRPPADPREE